MEAQWENATKLLNENVLHQQLEQVTAKLTSSNQEIIRLKKENQVLRLQANMIDPNDREAQEKNDIQRAEYKRQVEEVQGQLNRFDRLKTEEIQKLQITIAKLERQVQDERDRAD